MKTIQLRVLNYLKLRKVLILGTFGLFFSPLNLNASFESDTLFRIATAIKINPTVFFRGELPIYLERKITSNFSLEVAYLMTRRDLFGGTFDHDLDDLSGQVQIESGNGYKVAVRYYFQRSEELYGPYISGEYACREHKKYFFQEDSLGLVTTERLLDDRSYREYKLIGGMQNLSYYSNFFFDIYTGIGLKQKEFQEVHQRDPGVVPSHFLRNTQGEGISFYLGFKFGYGF